MNCPFCGATDHKVIEREGLPDIVVCPVMPRDQVFCFDNKLWKKALLDAAAEPVFRREYLAEWSDAHEERAFEHERLKVERPNRNGKLTGVS